MFSLLPRLRRITSGATWIPEIDGLRFVAIASVILFHIGAQLFAKSGHTFITQPWYAPGIRMMWNGRRGVELFFVISGFILGRPFARHALLGEKRVSLGHYYLRRLTRLEPPYVLNLLLFATAIYLYTHAHIAELFRHFLASALYIHEFVYKDASSINGVTWSLELEIQFYLLVPLLVLFYRIRRPLLRRGSLLAAILLFSWFQKWILFKNLWGTPSAIIYITVFIYLQYFLAGLLLSDLYLTALPKWRPHLAWDLASLAAWITIFFMNYSSEAMALPLLMIIAFLGAFRGLFFPRFFRLSGIALIGGMCYSLYLWHFFVIALIFKASKHLVHGHDLLLNLAVQWLCLLPGILLVSSAYYLLIERPCMDPHWPRKLAAKWKAAAESSAAA